MSAAADSSTSGLGGGLLPAELAALSLQEHPGSGTAPAALSNTSSYGEPEEDESALTPELIASVIKFIPWGSTSDRVGKHTLMNALLAVGPADATTCRLAYLKDERAGCHYLTRTCRVIAKCGSVDDATTNKRKRKMFQNIRAWMKVNPDWKGWCTSENMKEFAVVSKIDEEGDKASRPHPLALFTNPAVAIECGLLEVLKHLVEEVGIDVNSMEWSSFSSFRLVNLLAVAMMEDQRGCFNYLLKLPQIDLTVAPMGQNEGEAENTSALVHFAVENDPVRPIYLKALLQHPDVDVNETYAFGDEDDFDLLKYSTMVLVEVAGKNMSSRLIFAKMRMILEAGADSAFRCAHLAVVLMQRIQQGDLPNTFGSQDDFPIKAKVLDAAFCLFSEYMDWENVVWGDSDDDESSDNESSESYDENASSEEEGTDDEGQSFEESDDGFIDIEDLEEILLHEIGDEFIDIEDFEEIH